MPPIVDFTTECTREKEWDNVAAIHSGLVTVTTWSFHRSKMGALKLVPEQFQNKNRKDFNAEATCVALTHCGNFVIVGKLSIGLRLTKLRWLSVHLSNRVLLWRR